MRHYYYYYYYYYYLLGEALYTDKPTMRRHHGAMGTWSDDEYAHAGLQVSQ